ncbi:MAG TPA: FAD binding domain-containing protein [Candidatus Limnocylindrales bacterium]|nr:FAD binding domain-containing protein [Candidatus Limnocylindrales bacterium]
MAGLTTPSSLAEALEDLAAVPPSRPIAGGVGFLLRRQLGETLPERFVAVGCLPELRAIERLENALAIGAAVSLAELAASPIVRTDAPLLAAAAAAAANPGIRTTATLGGNLLDRPGGSDLMAALLALGARAAWARPGGVTEDSVPLDGPVGDGLLLRVRTTVPTAAAWGFERLRTRGAGDRPTATVCVTLADARAENAIGRAWATSVAPRPVELSETLAAAIAAASDEEIVAATDVDLRDVVVVDDLRATAEYRRRVLPVLVRRAVAQARRRS